MSDSWSMIHVTTITKKLQFQCWTNDFATKATLYGQHKMLSIMPPATQKPNTRKKVSDPRLDQTLFTLRKVSIDNQKKPNQHLAGASELP